VSVSLGRRSSNPRSSQLLNTVDGVKTFELTVLSAAVAGEEDELTEHPRFQRCVEATEHDSGEVIKTGSIGFVLAFRYED
jgi:hypothetical protein